MGHLGNADRAECEGPNAEWFCRRLTEQLTQPKEASAIWKSARDAVKTAGMFYYELKPSLVRAVENNFIHYTTLKLAETTGRSAYDGADSRDAVQSR